MNILAVGLDWSGGCSPAALLQSAAAAAKPPFSRFQLHLFEMKFGKQLEEPPGNKGGGEDGGGNSLTERWEWKIDGFVGALSRYELPEWKGTEIGRKESLSGET